MSDSRNFSKQYAEGQLFADDFEEKCTLHDSCSYVSYKLSEYLLKIPVLLNWNTKNEKIRLYLGLSNYSILNNHYSSEANESSIHILKIQVGVETFLNSRIAI